MSSDSVKNYNIDQGDESSEYDDFSEDDPTTYYRNLGLRYFAANPLKILTDHVSLLDKCLEAGNPEAHYIEGLLQFFHHHEERTGLRHLRVSSNLGNKNGTYAYGLLMLSHGHYWKGMKYLDKLPWCTNLAKSNKCWERIKISLRGIPIQMTQDYHTNWVNLKPRFVCCKPDDMDEVCGKCYYYKRLTLFVELAGHPTHP